MSRLLASADAVLSLDDEEDDLLQRLEPAVRPVRLRNGLHIGAIREEDVESARPLEVLFLAHLHPIKRVLVFAEAMLLIANQFPDVRFSVVGPDQGDLPQLQEMLAEHPSGARIKIRRAQFRRVMPWRGSLGRTYTFYPASTNGFPCPS